MSKDPVSVYGFINAKLRAKIGLMRQSRIIEDLLKAASLVEAVSVLRDSPYHALAEAYDQTGDLQQMEYVLLEMEIAMYREVASYLEGKSATFVNHLLGKIEVDNLKNSIRLWYSSIIRGRPIRYRSGYLYKQTILHPIDWTAMVNATGWETLLKALGHSPYEGILKEYTEQDLQKDGLFSLESKLDGFWYEHMLSGIQTLSRQDREVASAIFAVEVDLKNLLTLARYGWYHRMEGSALRTLLLPWGKVAESKETERYIQAPVDDRDPVALINRFAGGLEQDSPFVQRGSIHSEETSVLENLKIEDYLEKRRHALYRKMLSSDPFTIALALSYFFLNKEESSMIKAILNGKYYGYDEAYIRGVIG